MEKDVSIGLLGLGVVGSGVIKIVEDHQEELQHQLGRGVKVEKVLVRDIEKARQIEIDHRLLTTNCEDVLANPDIDVVVEVMGGVENARKYILEALQAKKHVVTANKDLIALHGPELEETARQNGCDLFYEASVGGGIPLLRGLSDGLVSDRIQQVMGIVNGTTNYILTKMAKEGQSYEDALQKAQELGFAEADPTADVEGLDAARKMVILARLSFFTNVELEDVEVEGISKLSLTDIEYGKKLDLTMKLIGFANRHDNQIEVSVQPTFLSKSHPLASVNDEYNAVYVNGEAVGETMFYGPGAGSLPTATAVMSDVVEAIKNMLLGVNGKKFVKPRFEKELTPSDKRFGQFYLRLHVKDEIGAFASISDLFNRLDISFERILQTPSEKGFAEIIVVTHKTSLENFQNAMKKLDELQVIDTVESYFRVEGDA
ncbi:homoserine dehydrogenase [Pseudogracilibacillus auburnensis]|uniref:homoserine dehydrogenase n=1 Tax=Pseudogracilibacillus auburnensis TaxID=1494959 RepID=UPI001A976F2D|nr:homoserine dehydrogenase [Pseudogracilibacillus auburnensis]MBO1004680.1 homoserine dehydrogenase [Pseudogracilibacillus auburnensis]